MNVRPVLALVRAASAGLVFVAIVVQAIVLADAGAFNPTRFFAFFTILSNLFGAILFVVLAARWRSAHTPTLDFLRGASVVYMTVTFLVVIWLLSDVDVGLQLKWVDNALHKTFPVIVVIDWLVDPPETGITFRKSLWWLAYPLMWTGFTVVRGAAEGWYPYPFLNPANGGYGAVAVVSAAILVGFLAIAWVTVRLGNAMRDRGRVALP